MDLTDQQWTSIEPLFEQNRIFSDSTRDFSVIRYREWPGYRDRSYRQLAPHERESDLPKPVERGRDIFAPLELLGAYGQVGIWASKEQASRDHLNTHADRLAARIDRPPVTRSLI